MEPNAPLLSAEGYRLSIASRVLAESLSFQLAPGEVLWLRGPNGAGKSTLLRRLAEAIEKGHAENLRIGVEPEQVEFLPQVAASRALWPLRLRDLALTLGGPEVLSRYAELLPEYLDASWNEASGGERQRTLAAALLSREPRLLLLDEPTNHLDTESRGRILAALRDHLRHAPTERAAVLVSHDPPEIEAFSSLSLRSLELGGPE